MKIIYKDGHVDECPQDQELHVIRHTAAHIMAQAIKRLHPQADFAFGPATENGFYYDVDLGDQKLSDTLMMWMEPQQWHSVVDTGLGGFYNVTRPLLKDMLVKRFGRIVNIVSLSGIKGLPGQTNYSAAKGGVIAATKALAQEVAKKGVTVNAIAPGFVRTDMTADLDEAELKKQIPAGRFCEAEEVADLAMFLISDKASYITGEVISINGGLYT